MKIQKCFFKVLSNKIIFLLIKLGENVNQLTQQQPLDEVNAKGYETKEHMNVYLNKATNMLNGIQSSYGKFDIKNIRDSSKFIPNSKIIFNDFRKYCMGNT